MPWIGLAALFLSLATSGSATRATPETPTPETPTPKSLAPVDEGGDGETGKERKANRLIHEKSPYLRQHAQNPVDWYPWGEEALAKARAEGKPIFLSIGYSTCHWCHVMERESFENEAIARFLNEHFVAIKVDREERPDVDGVYMSAVQAMGQNGGWPLSAFLLPSGRPFFGGTYFPPDHFLQLLERIVEMWGGNRAAIDTVAERLTEHLRTEAARVSASKALTATATVGVVEYLSGVYDEDHGGFSGPPRYAPKFPRTSTIELLLTHASRTGDERAKRMALRTLDHMIAGGIRDQLGGGFHRYSTDRRWVVPHFEKMLYDNALLARALVEGFRVSGDRKYLDVARETLEYVLERLRGEHGEFYCAEDADTEGVEGLTYVWTRAEILEQLGETRGQVFCARHGVSEEGNFEEGPEHSNVLVLAASLEELATRFKRPVDEIAAELERARKELLARRALRPQPFLDTKALTGWNGLAISAFARFASVSGEKRYLEAAGTAADFVLDRLRKEGRLLRRYRDGEAAIAAFLDDHAYFIDGLIDLFEAGFQPRHLEAARELALQMVARFWDEKSGGFFSSGDDHESLVIREKELYDGALPSGGSVALRVLYRLRALTEDATLAAILERYEGLATAAVSEHPQLHPELARALELELLGQIEIVIVGPDEDARTRSLLAEVRSRFLPSAALVHVDSKESAASLATLVPLVDGKTQVGEKPTAFVCRDRVCRLPVFTPEALRLELDRLLAGTSAGPESSSSASSPPGAATPSGAAAPPSGR